MTGVDSFDSFYSLKVSDNVFQFTQEWCSTAREGHMKYDTPPPSDTWELVFCMEKSWPWETKSKTPFGRHEYIPCRTIF